MAKTGPRSFFNDSFIASITTGINPGSSLAALTALKLSWWFAAICWIAVIFSCVVMALFWQKKLKRGKLKCGNVAGDSPRRAGYVTSDGDPSRRILTQVRSIAANQEWVHFAVPAGA